MPVRQRCFWKIQYIYGQLASSIFWVSLLGTFGSFLPTTLVSLYFSFLCFNLFFLSFFLSPSLHRAKTKKLSEEECQNLNGNLRH